VLEARKETPAEIAPSTCYAAKTRPESACAASWPAPRQGPAHDTATRVNEMRVADMAEAFNSISKAELVRNKGPWRGLDDLEIATVEYIDWYSNRRLHGRGLTLCLTRCGDCPEFG
jgi:hypothetical protein